MNGVHVGTVSMGSRFAATGSARAIPIAIELRHEVTLDPAHRGRKRLRILLPYFVEYHGRHALPG